MAEAISRAVIATVRRSATPAVGLRLVLNQPCCTASCTQHTLIQLTISRRGKDGGKWGGVFAANYTGTPQPKTAIVLGVG